MVDDELERYWVVGGAEDVSKKLAGLYGDAGVNLEVSLSGQFEAVLRSSVLANSDVESCYVVNRAHKVSGALMISRPMDPAWTRALVFGYPNNISEIVLPLPDDVIILDSIERCGLSFVEN